MRMELHEDDSPTGVARAYFMAKGAELTLHTVCPSCRTTSATYPALYTWVVCDGCGEKRTLTWGTRGQA